MVWSSIGPRIVGDGVTASLVAGTSSGGARWGLCTNALSPEEADAAGVRAHGRRIYIGQETNPPSKDCKAKAMSLAFGNRAYS